MLSCCVTLLLDVVKVRGEIRFKRHLFNILEGDGSLVVVMLMKQARYKVFL